MVGEFFARHMESHSDSLQTLGRPHLARPPSGLRFKDIGRTCGPEIALLPIGAYHPESFRNVHMGPDEAIKVFKDLKAQWLVPMHYGAFRLSFEDMDEPPRWLRQVAEAEGLTKSLMILEEGLPQVF